MLAAGEWTRLEELRLGVLFNASEDSSPQGHFHFLCYNLDSNQIGDEGVSHISAERFPRLKEPGA